jgi:hypothetical protein
LLPESVSVPVPIFMRPPEPPMFPPFWKDRVFPLPTEIVRSPLEAEVANLIWFVPAPELEMSVPDDDNCRALPARVKPACVNVRLSKVVLAVRLFVLVTRVDPEKTRPLVATGAVPVVQLAAVFQLLSGPPPFQVRSVCARTACGANAKTRAPTTQCHRAITHTRRIHAGTTTGMFEPALDCAVVLGRDIGKTPGELSDLPKD